MSKAKPIITTVANHTKTMNHDNFFANRGLTEDGSAWVTRALDPFHDYNVQIAGMPDHDTEPTAIQTLRRKITITKPSGLAAGAKFDVHIFTLPILETLKVRELGPTSRAHLYDGIDTGTSEFDAGTVNVQIVESGSNTFPGDGAYGSVGVRSVQALSVNDNNGLSQKKIIGGGFEIHNDTSALNMGGSCLVYTQPQSDVHQLTLVSSNGASALPAAVHKGRAPPVNIGSASQIPNSKTWQASEGCYVPFRLDIAKGSEFKPKSVDLPAYVVNDDVGSDLTGGVVAEASSSTGMRYLSPGLTSGCHHAPIETVGAYFTGLPEDSVLTLDVLFLVEVCPTSANPALLSLVRPTAFFDPTALELYCRTVAAIPAGTPVANNNTGSWWRMVKDVARQVMPYVGAAAPIVLSATGHPVAASAVTAMNGVRLSQLPPSRPTSTQKRPKPKPKPTHNYDKAEAELKQSYANAFPKKDFAKAAGSVLATMLGSSGQTISRRRK